MITHTPVRCTAPTPEEQGLRSTGQAGQAEAQRTQKKISGYFLKLWNLFELIVIKFFQEKRQDTFRALQITPDDKCNSTIL